MSRPPMKTKQAPARNLPFGQKVAAPTPAAVAKSARDSSEDLQEAAREARAPDYEVGSATPESGGEADEKREGAGTSPVYKPALPWPAVDAGRKPFRLRG